MLQSSGGSHLPLPQLPPPRGAIGEGAALLAVAAPSARRTNETESALFILPSYHWYVARALLAVLFAIGCGQSAPIADAGADAAPFVPGPHGALPREINIGGSVLVAPKVVPIFFANDELESLIEDLLAQLPPSPYWDALETEYGVGPLTVAPSIVLSDAPPQTATQDDAAAFIRSKLASDATWPAPTDQTIYFVYYPVSTTLTLGSSTLCADFLGYHYYGQTASSSTFVFAVQGRCAKGTFNQTDDATQNTTHELVEAATDPLLGSYVTQDAAHAVWTRFPGAEIGDLCEFESLSFQRFIGFDLMSRFWSSSAAAAGHDPCVPPIAFPYFNSVPVLPDQIPVTIYSGPVVTSGVAVPLGTSKTIDVQLYSDAPTGDWNVEADDATNYVGANAGELQFSWNKTIGNNGDTLELTITRVKDGALGGTEMVIHSSQSQAIWHAYFAWVGN